MSLIALTSTKLPSKMLIGISSLLRGFRIASLSVLMFLGSWVSAGAATAADFLSATLPKAGVEPNDLPYRYLVPAGYNAANLYPLIVFLHGSGERGNDNSAQLNNNANGALQLVSTTNQAISPCFMIAPQASVSEGWNANTLGQVIRAIQQLETTYSIDPNRIYVTGLSMGGAGSWDIIVRYPFFFAAAAPMSGWGAGSYEKIVGLPIWAFHAANDGTVAVSGSDNAVSATRQAGGRVIYTRYATGGHGIWPTAYANPYLRPWLLAQYRNEPMEGVPIVSIASPAQHLALPPATSSKSVTGTASIPGGVTQINWTFTPWVGGAGVDTSSYALATGTDNWSVANAVVAGNSTLFLAIATGPSWATGTGSATGGGITTLNDYFWNVPTGANVVSPTIALSSPTNSGVLTTAAVSLNLAGTAAPAGSKTVQAVTWRNDRGGEGFGLGTTAWHIDSIDLLPGDNLITVTVRDSSSITASTALMVHVTSGVGDTISSDFNADGKSDILWSNTATGDRAMWQMNGSAISTNAFVGTVPAAWVVSGTGDFDGDGKADIFWTNTTTGDRAVWLMNGSSASGGGYLGVVPVAWVVSGTGDFNGDGKADVLWTNTATGERAIWQMNGSTSSAGASLGVVPLVWVVSGTGDFNGDGKADIFLSNTVTGDRAMWFMNGTTITTNAFAGTVPVDWTVGGAGDFNGDGKADIFWTNAVTGDRAVWLMNGATISAGGYLGAIPVTWVVNRANGDYNGDGKADILWTNTTTGERAMWLMNGIATSGGASLGVVPLAWVPNN